MNDSQNSLTRVVVLGAGRVGLAISRDLAADPRFAVTAVDRDPSREELLTRHGVSFRAADLGQQGLVRQLVAGFDLVVGAVPGWMGFRVLREVIEAGKNVVDISFFEEDPFLLQELAEAHGVTAVVDCGVAPGLSNLVLGRMQEEFDSIDSFACLVGGLPEAPTPPWNYRAPYSPSDVIEMYTRPARLVREGKQITLPALTEPEPVEVPGVGTLEAFNTDGLRTLLSVKNIPHLVEKTLRYPGHRSQIALLASGGFFDVEREVNGEVIRPREVSTALLFEQWFQGEHDYDVTVLRLVTEGIRQGAPVRLVHDLVDHFDRESGISSMARTTGYPCTAVARLLAQGDFTEPGIAPPERIGANRSCYDAILTDLKQRGVEFQVTEASPSQDELLPVSS